VEEDKDDLHALLERAAKLMVKVGYSALGVRIKVAGKEKGYVFMESSVWCASWGSARLPASHPPPR
jgi:hypothetical protein